ncbi:hypothetical protein C482_13565 [Natrialba chahannaoensis JCM 10990]|uniref:Uncharacterized protein n=1 Tax=Natrialba chahannaoensis JCM 10990 TaxID=1227492 RepID=M0AET4_9EURY|nr:hypothetical protein [Natrialba chahannaoensis]ELY97265.1 hypothetical protein C482_13565 [Natrialba chahannaoensis JCM 10990]
MASLVTTTVSRRTFAALSGSAVLAFLAGCLNASSSADSTPANGTNGTNKTNETPTDTEPNHGHPDALESVESDALERAVVRDEDESENWESKPGVYSVRIRNAMTDGVSATVKLEHDGESVLDRELRIPSDGDVVLELRARGTYSLGVKTEAATVETTVSWEPADCTTGTTALTISASGIETEASIQC